MTKEQSVEKPDEGRRRQAVSVALIVLMWFVVPAIAFCIGALIYGLSDSIGYALLIAYGWVVVSIAVLMRIFNRRSVSQADFVSPRDGEGPPVAGEKFLVLIAFVGFLATLFAMATSDSY